MKDKFGREINYLRISVTDLCNLRCVYCMGEEGIEKLPHQKILTYEEIFVIAKVAVTQFNFKKIRLTGGEPLVRPAIESLVKSLSRLYSYGLETIAMTTNGHFLKEKALILKKNGLKSVNISLDTLNEKRYFHLTRGGNIKKVLSGIDAAIAAGFQVKLNMVVMNETTAEEIDEMKRFAQERGIKLQLINHFDLSQEKMDQYQFDRPPPCHLCNRLRLLPIGVLKPCLHSNLEIPLDLGQIASSLEKAILAKPEHGYKCDNRKMNQIGG